MDTNKNTHKHQTQLEFHPQNHHHLPLEDHGLPPYHGQHQIPQETMKPLPSSSSSSSAFAIGNLFRSKDCGGAYDLGELDQPLFLYLDGHDPSSSSSFVQQDQKQIQSGMRPHTLNIFPSQPMRVNPSTKVSSGGLVSTGRTSCSKRPSETTTSMELANQRINNNNIDNNNNNNKNNKNFASAPPHPPAEPAKTIKRGGNRKGPNNTTSELAETKTSDPKTLRRLAQNREAARKSRLRKKAYIQQLESSRIKLTQLEQELCRARSQGILVGVANEQVLPVNIGHISSAIFDMEYARWLEEHHRLMCELRMAIQEHLPENELQLFVENGLAHYDEMMNLKEIVVKSDVFHLASGMWMTPTERCFMWLGGFRPSELIKVILTHVEPLTEQQILGICGLQQSSQEAEETLSLGHEALNQSLSDTISYDSLSYPTNMANYLGQMAAAMDKLSTLEGYIRQAEGLRQQMIHRLHQILTTHQFARCLLSIAEYFHRLRALSSLWLSRPRQD